MKWIAIFLILTSCATYGPVADGISTQAALNAGGIEANPLLFGGHPVALAVSVVGRTAYIKSQRHEPGCTANVGLVEAVGWGAACNNLAVVLGAAPHISLPLLGICAIAHHKTQRDEIEQWCYPSCSLADIPEGTKAAECVRGEVVVRR